MAAQRAHLATQAQIRNNARDLQEIWSDLGEWEEEMKTKDRKLLEGEEGDNSTGFYDLLNEDGELLMDVNSEVMQEEELKQHATKVSAKFVEANAEALAAKEKEMNERIKPKTYQEERACLAYTCANAEPDPSQEYDKWDAFDVDEQLKAFDAKAGAWERKEKQEQEQKKAAEARQQQAEKKRRKKDKKEEGLELKEEGNAAFKQALATFPFTPIRTNKLLINDLKNSIKSMPWFKNHSGTEMCTTFGINI